MSNKKRWNRAVTIFLHVLLLLTLYVMQAAILPYLRLGGLVPLLLPVSAAGIALYEGRDAGGIFGLFAGILCDISLNQPVGMFTVILTTTGLAVGMLSDAIILSSFTAYILICAAILSICVFVQMTPIVAVPNNIPIRVILGTAIAQTIYSIVLAVPMFFIIRALGGRKL